MHLNNNKYSIVHIVKLNVQVLSHINMRFCVYV